MSAITANFGYKDYALDFNCTTASKVLTKDKLSSVNVDFAFRDLKDLSRTVYAKLNQDGRFWYAVLRGLGYTCDFTDERPVSVLPLFAFVKAYYDIYYPKRYNSWHSSNYYRYINSCYNGIFCDWVYNNHHYIGADYDLLCSLFGSDHSFSLMVFWTMMLLMLVCLLPLIRLFLLIRIIMVLMVFLISIPLMTSL